MIVNCSVNAEHAKFTQATVEHLVEQSYVPTDSSLFVISDNKETATENDNDTTKPSFLNNQNETIKTSQHNKSSQRAAVDFVLLPEFLSVNYGENRNENSIKSNQSIQADPRQQHKRMADTQDICDTNECKCKTETKFLTVDCNFQQVSIFNDHSFTM